MQQTAGRCAGRIENAATVDGLDLPHGKAKASRKRTAEYGRKSRSNTARRLNITVPTVVTLRAAVGAFARFLGSLCPNQRMRIDSCRRMRYTFNHEARMRLAGGCCARCTDWVPDPSGE